MLLDVHRSSWNQIKPHQATYWLLRHYILPSNHYLPLFQIPEDMSQFNANCYNNNFKKKKIARSSKADKGSSQLFTVGCCL